MNISTDLSRKPRLMLIDDERMDQMMYRRVLSRSNLVDEVIGCATAMDALEKLRDPDFVPPDVILLDINMPKMSGFDFLDAATAEFGPDFTAAIVIMLTTSLDPKDIERAKSYSVVKDFVSKPLTDEALGTISHFLAARDMPPSA